MHRPPADDAQTRPAVPVELFKLAAPIIGVNVLNLLALTVDTAMCGHLDNGDDVLAALSFATQLIFLLMVGMMGLSIGTVATVARAYGAKDHDRVNHVLRQAFWLTLGIGAGVAVVGNLSARTLLELLGAKGVVVDIALDYLRPLLWGTVFNYLVILLAAVLRGVGNTRIAFVIALVTNGLNVVINSFLIHGNWGAPALGIFGAACGTVISQGVGTLTYIVVLKRGTLPGVELPLAPPKFDREIAQTLLRIGTPAALDMVVLNAALISMVAMLSRIDAMAVAGHGIGLRVQGLAFLPGLSIAQATGALVGQALGAQDDERLAQVVRTSKWMTSATMGGIGLIMFFFAGPLVGIFDVKPGTPLDAFAQTWMRLLSCGMPFVGYYFAIFGVLQGAGATKVSLRINTVTTLLAQIPLSALFGFALGWGAFGVWLAFPLSYLPKSALGWWTLKQGGWRQQARVGGPPPAQKSAP